MLSKILNWIKDFLSFGISSKRSIYLDNKEFKTQKEMLKKQKQIDHHIEILRKFKEGNSTLNSKTNLKKNSDKKSNTKTSTKGSSKYSSNQNDVSSMYIATNYSSSSSSGGYDSCSSSSGSDSGSSGGGCD